VEKKERGRKEARGHCDQALGCEKKRGKGGRDIVKTGFACGGDEHLKRGRKVEPLSWHQKEKRKGDRVLFF